MNPIQKLLILLCFLLGIYTMIVCIFTDKMNSLILETIQHMEVKKIGKFTINILMMMITLDQM